MTRAFASWQQGTAGQSALLATTGLAEPSPLPPISPLRTCKDNRTIECFCKGRQTALGVLTGFAASPFDASGSSYLGCSAIGQVQVYYCGAGSTFTPGRGCLQVASGTDAPGQCSAPPAASWLWLLCDSVGKHKALVLQHSVDLGYTCRDTCDATRFCTIPSVFDNSKRL